MPRVILKRWNPGLKKVSLTKLLQEQGGLSLTSAKQCVDRLLEGQSTSVNVTTVEHAIELARRIEELGAECEVNDDGAFEAVLQQP